MCNIVLVISPNIKNLHCLHIILCKYASGVPNIFLKQVNFSKQCSQCRSMSRARSGQRTSDRKASSQIIIFRSICNIQEKLFIQYSVQWGQNSFFYLTKTANSFYSKINDSSMVWTTAFSSSRFGVRVSAVPNIFTIYP